MTKRDYYAEATAKRVKAQERVVVKIDEDLLDEFDKKAAAMGFASRADAIRGLMKSFLGSDIVVGDK